MIGLAVAFALFLAVVLQTSFAPYFPLAGATFDVPLVALVLLTRFRGPKAAMVAVPLVALLAGFLAGRAPALLLLAYLPLVPLAYWLDERGPPVGDFLRTAMLTGAVGIWLRFLLVLAGIADGAEFDLGLLLGRVVLPGLLLDLALLAVAYGPLRSLGWQQRSMRLQRGSYSSL